jgi:hypothetical protein
MKKLALALVAIAALLVVGCSGVGPTGGAAELVGTWVNVVKQYMDLSTTPAASTKEGTWAIQTITYPTTPSVSTSGGITTTTHAATDTTTVTNTVNLVINASGSFVRTATTATVWTARTASPADTATVFNIGGTAIAAGSRTDTTTKTATVTVVGNYYKEVIETALSTVYAGSTPAGVAYVANDNTSSTSTTTSELYTAGALGYNTAIAGLVQTVLGTTAMGTPTNKMQTATMTSTVAFAKDGTYTLTVVTLTDLPAIDAVAATANSAAIVATVAGTSTETVTTTGTYTNAKLSYDSSELTAGGYYKEAQDLYLYAQDETVTRIATGFLISTTYPAVAKTSFNNTLGTTQVSIVVSGDSIIFNPAGPATVYVKAAA